MHIDNYIPFISCDYFSVTWLVRTVRTLRTRKCDPFDQTLSCGCKKGLGTKLRHNIIWTHCVLTTVMLCGPQFVYHKKPHNTYHMGTNCKAVQFVATPWSCSVGLLYKHCSKPLKVCYCSQNHMTVPCGDHMHSHYLMQVSGQAEVSPHTHTRRSLNLCIWQVLICMSFVR